MERHKTSSQVSIDKKPTAHKENNIASVNKQNQLQNEIDNLIQHGILNPMMEYDSKLDFQCLSIVNRDHILKQTRRQTCGLIWNSIRSPMISKLIHDDRSCAFVEIFRPPSDWSRYDIDTLLVKIKQKTFLNGLALRDEFVRVLQVILKRDFNEENNTEKKYTYEFKDMGIHTKFNSTSLRSSTGYGINSCYFPGITRRIRCTLHRILSRSLCITLFT